MVRIHRSITWAIIAMLSGLGASPAFSQINGTANRLVKFKSPTTGIDSQVFDNGTNIGIGTTNPQYLLHLYRAEPPRSTVGMLMGNSTTGPGQQGFLIDYHRNGGAELWNFENTSMWFGTNDTRRLTITNGGRITIQANIDASGTSGTGSLEIAGQLRLDGNEIITNDGATLFLNHDNAGDVQIDSTTFHLRASTNQIGIGGPPSNTSYGDNTTLAPRLDVHGKMRLADVPVWDGPNAHDLTWGVGFADGLAYSPDRKLISREGSSRRYKTDIQPSDEDFTKILSAQPRRYRMRLGYGLQDVWNYGYIAEDLDEAGLKKLVIYDRDGRPDGVAYKKVAIYVNEVVKSQQKAIEQLQSDVVRLERLVRELSDR